MNPRHIVILNWKDPVHPESGGAEVYCTNVARELAAAGCRVTLVASRPRGAARSDSHDGYRIRRMGGTFTVYPLVLLWLLINRRRIDSVIDSQNGIPFFSPLAVRRRCAVVLLIHHVHQDQFGMYFPRPVAAVGRWLEGPASRRVYGRSAVCTVSPSTRTEVRRRLRFTGPIYVAPNGYRASVETDIARSAFPRIACVGRLVPHKRWNLLVNAVGDLIERGRPVHLDLLGDGQERAALQELIDHRSLNQWVTLHGFVPDDVRDELLGAAWISACTSVAEGWGLSVIEAAAQGVPTVALDVAGLRDSIRHGVTGWLTTEADLADALDRALTDMADPDEAKKIAEDCHDWAAALRWDWTADRFRAVLSAELKRSVTLPERRRSRADNSVMLTLSRGVAGKLDLHDLRITDQVNFCPACLDWCPDPLRVILHGADELDAIEVLERLGLNRRDGSIRIRLCRASDLVQWHVGTTPHNAPSLLLRDACPAAELRPDGTPTRRIA